MFPFVSIIIPALNYTKQLYYCLLALERQDYPKNRYEVIVVDNGSQDGIEKLKKFFPFFIFTYERKKNSYAARNKGISIAKGKILGFLDADCIPIRSWIKKGVESIETNLNCGLVGGRIEFFYSPKGPNVIEFLETITCLKQKNFIYKQRFSATANMFTLKEIIDKIGGFDFNLESGGDRIFGNKVFSAGYNLIYRDDLVVWHPARRTYKDFFKRQLRITRGCYQLYQNRYFNFKKAISYFNWPKKGTFINVLNKAKFKSFNFKFKIVFLMIVIKITRFFYFFWIVLKNFIIQIYRTYVYRN